MKTVFYIIMACMIWGCNSQNTSTNNSNLLIGSWVEPIAFDSIQMQGIEIKANGEAKSINMHTLIWKSWKYQNDTLFLTGRSLGNGESFDFIDTLKINTLTNDSLILSNGIRYKKAK